MMKVGIVTTWFERGAAYVSKLFKEHLENQGHEVFIYARGGEKYAIGDPIWDLKGVTWGIRNNIPISTYIDKKCFSEWLDKFSPEVVIFNEQVWFEPILLCRDRGIKVGAYVDYYTEEMIPTFKIYDFLICNTKKHMSVFDWHEQSHYVPWGTDIDVFVPIKRNIQNETKVVYFHSSGMNPFRKGTDLVLLAFSQMIKDGCEDSKLIIHSQVSLLDFFKSNRKCHNYNCILEEIKYLEEKGCLEIINKTITAPGLYSCGDVYVYPSRLDGLGLTVAEAISSGLPVIVPNDGPMNEFVTPESGCLVEVERFYSRSDGYYWPQNKVNIDALTKAMKKYHNMSLGELIGKKKAARDYAIEHLDAAKNFIALSDIIKNCKIISLDYETIKYINNYHGKKWILISNHAFIFNLIYKAVNSFKTIIYR